MSKTRGSITEYYHIFDTSLGKGSYGSVYKAQHKDNGLEVAIKKIDKQIMKEKQMLLRVQKEVEIHSRLRHSAVVQVYDVFEDSDYIYLVLELCHNGTMMNYLKSRKRLTEDEVREFMKQIVEGVSYLHKHRIMHRDLSLANILLTKDMKVKIGDFGLAAKLEALDKHMTMCGTPNYMCPEIASSFDHGLESDLWSLGCILYTLLEGRAPFDTDGLHNQMKPEKKPVTDKDSIFSRIRMAKYPPPERSSSNACDLIGALLRENPKERLRVNEILSHPFMTKLDNINMMQRMRDMSVDSGHGTYSRYSISSNMSALGNRLHHHLLPAHRLPQMGRPPQDAQTVGDRVNQLSMTSESNESRLCGPEALNRESPRILHQCAQHSSTCSSVCSHASSSSRRQVQQSTQGQPSLVSQPESSLITQHSQQNVGQFIPAQRQADSSKVLASFHTKPGTPIHLQQNQRGMPPPGLADYADQQSQRVTQNVQVSQTARNSQPQGNLLEQLSKQIQGPHPTEQTQPNLPGKAKTSPGSCITVDPINTQRLRPFRQQTSRLVVSILQNGLVSAEIIRKKQGSDRVKKVMLISGDGRQIVVYHPTEPGGVPLADQPPPPPAPAKCFRYEYPVLPEKYIQLYHYVAKLIHKIKTKTPMVTMFTEKAKCMLMENTPDPNFRAEFYDGSEVSVYETGLTIIEPNGSSINLGSVDEVSSTSSTVSNEDRARIDYALYNRACCLKTKEIHSTMQSDNYRPFPIIMGERPHPPDTSGLSRFMTSATVANSGQDENHGGTANIDHQIPTSSSRPEQNGSCAKTSSIRPQVPATSRVPEHDGDVRVQASEGTKAYCSFPVSLHNTVNQTLDTTSLSVPSSASSNSSTVSSSHRSPLVLTDLAIAGVKHVLKSARGDICINFLDGSKIAVSEKIPTISYLDASGAAVCYQQSDAIPAEVRHKVEKIPLVLEALMRQSKDLARTRSSSLSRNETRAYHTEG